MRSDLISRNVAPATLLGGGLILLGLWELAATQHLPSTTLYSSNVLSALGVGFSGVALILIAAWLPLQRRGQIAIGIGLLFAAAVAVWLGDASPSVAIPLAMIGAAFIAFHITLIPPALIQLSWLGLFVVAVVGLASHSTHLGVLYQAYSDIAIPIAVIAALAATAIGLWWQSRLPEWRVRFDAEDDDRRISVISAAILLTVAISAGIAGFVLMARITQTVLTNSLTISLEHRVRSFQTAIDTALREVVAVSTRPHLNALMTKRLTGSLSATESTEIEALLEDIVKHGAVTAIRLDGANDRTVSTHGTLVTDAEYAVPLNVNATAQLLWKNGSLLRVYVPLLQNGRRIGSITADVRTAAIDQLYRDTAGLGRSGRMGVCAADGSWIKCLPSAPSQYRTMKAPRVFNGEPVPMSYALDGKTGIVNTLDVNGENVISTYAPIGTLGLGMIVKVRASELYQPVRQQLVYIIGAVFVLVILGMMLLRWQITPLARSLVAQIRERKAAEDRYAYLAHHDGLTGLPNRVLFHERLHLAMADAGRHQQLVAVMFLDIDRFKTINDTLGHEAGDLLLKDIATRLAETLRTGDTLSRLAGDEFGLILPDVVDTAGVQHLAQRLIGSFAAPFNIKQQQLFITASIGITLYPLDASSIDNLLKNADTAMYRAKDSGRNMFQFYSADMHAQAVSRLALEQDLRGAIERRELLLHYQPLVNLRNGTVEGMEALIRWQHPRLGLVPPADFIAVAEETGLIIPIGEWVLRTACAQARRWQNERLPPLRLSVNVSARQFHKDLPALVATILEDVGLAPQYLELELTETVVMQNPDAALLALRALDRMGVKLSIDDFGTGYSSLSYLKRLPINTLKIDRSFVRDIPEDAEDVLITTAIITLAHSLGVQVVAEGVESTAQLEFLRAQNCDVMQGYLFSKPLPAEAFAALVREQRTLAVVAKLEVVRRRLGNIRDD